MHGFFRLASRWRFTSVTQFTLTKVLQIVYGSPLLSAGGGWHWDGMGFWEQCGQQLCVVSETLSYLEFTVLLATTLQRLRPTYEFL